MKKIELEAERKRKKRFTFLISVSVGITIMLALLQVALSNRLASFSEELAKLEEAQQQFSYENELLKKNVASVSAIAAIAQKAHTLSLTEASKFLVIEEAESVALLSGKHGF